MKTHEKTALLQYIEFHLLKLCEHTEKNLDPDAVGALYLEAYGILSDLDESILLELDKHQNTSKR